MLSMGLMLLGFLSLACGLILDAVARGRKENRRLAYLAIPPLESVGVTAACLIGGAAGPAAGRYDADIIILALERPAETVAAIMSACGQTGVSTHLFVLDQGSCAETLRRLAAAVGDRANATLLAVDKNLGVAGGRNLMSGLGHGRVIVALDNDAEFAASDTVARLVAALDAEPRLAAIGCRIVTHAQGADDLSSWGYPANLLPCAGESFDTVTYVGAGHAIRRTRVGTGRRL